MEKCKSGKSQIFQKPMRRDLKKCKITDFAKWENVKVENHRFSILLCALV